MVRSPAREASVTDGVERDQAGQGVADRRGGREIAGDGAEIADLARADAAHQRAERREMPVEMRQRLRIGDGAAERRARRASLVIRRSSATCAVEITSGKCLAILADAQPEIGAAGEQERVRMLRARREQFVERARREKSLAAVAIVGAGRQLAQRRRGCGRVAGKAVGRPRADPPAGIDDRAIAGAAAEIAGERLVDERILGRLAAVVEREHRHREARRAEAALRGVGVDQRLLHRMQRAVARRQPLDREHRAAVELRQHHQAGIDRLVVQLPVGLAPDHDACRRRNRPRRSLPWCRSAAPRAAASRAPSWSAARRPRRAASPFNRKRISAIGQLAQDSRVPLPCADPVRAVHRACHVRTIHRRPPQTAPPRRRWRSPACSCRPATASPIAITVCPGLRQRRNRSAVPRRAR